MRRHSGGRSGPFHGFRSHSLDISLLCLPCAGVKHELHSADAQLPSIVQEIAPSASFIYVNAIHRIEILNHPLTDLPVDAGVMMGNGLPGRKVLRDDQVVFHPAPDAKALRFQGEALWTTGETHALQVGAEDRGARRSGRGRGRGWLLFSPSQQDKQ